MLQCIFSDMVVQVFDFQLGFKGLGVPFGGSQSVE